MPLIFLKPLCKFGLSLALLLGLHAAHAQDTQGLAAIPTLSAHVVDAAQMLPPEQRESLEASLTLYEQTKGTQIAILTIPSTAPEVIEQYAIRVADTWKLGRKGVADGIIILIAKDNPAELHRLRIEVGKGLEGAIPDAVAKRIIDESIAPQFRQENYYGGLVAGVNRIKSALDGEALPPPRRTNNMANAGVSKWFPFLLFGLFFVVLILMRLGGRQVAHLSGNRNDTGSQFSNHGMLLPTILASILSNSGRGGGGGGFGGGGGGGGGFSGGGGDFGGGGASGNW